MVNDWADELKFQLTPPLGGDDSLSTHAGGEVVSTHASVRRRR